MKYKCVFIIQNVKVYPSISSVFYCPTQLDIITKTQCARYSVQRRVMALLDIVPPDAHSGVQQEIKEERTANGTDGCLSVSSCSMKELFKFSKRIYLLGRCVCFMDTSEDNFFPSAGFWGSNSGH